VSSSLRLISSWAAAPEVGFFAADTFVLVLEATFNLEWNISGNKEINCCSGFSTMRDGRGSLSEPPGEAELRPSPHPPADRMKRRSQDLGEEPYKACTNGRHASAEYGSGCLQG
jgi:hypothetical protein